MNARAVRGVAGAAAVIGVATVASRAAGFGRQLVYTHAVGETALGKAYTTANFVPNIVFEVAAGGALASLVVPVLAGPVARRDTEHASRVASALLTWVVAVLVPVALVGAALVHPLTRLLLHQTGTGTPGVTTVSARLLTVFMPQTVLYGLAVVSAGVLVAHRRFLAAALAPLLSSVVVAAAYLAFGRVGHGDLQQPSTVPRGAVDLLGWGTTAGVVVLAGTTLLPMAGLGLRLRPTLRFPEGVAPRVRGLAGAGVLTLAAQQTATVAVIVLTNGRGPQGAVVTYQNAWMVYLLPYAVLAVPIATSAFPRIAALAESGDRAALATLTASTTRAVILVSSLGAGLLAGTAVPVAAVFAAIGRGSAPAAGLAPALVAFAPGLLGYGLVAHLGRALYALDHGRRAAAAVCAGWLVFAAAAVVTTAVVPGRDVVVGIGLASSAGMTVSGVLLVAALRGTAGADAVHGVARATAFGLTAALAAAGVGSGLARLAAPHGLLPALGVGLACAVLAATVSGGALVPLLRREPVVADLLARRRAAR